VRYGEPYALVVGNSTDWKGVDRVVAIVKDEIHRHRKNCGCFLAQRIVNGDLCTSATATEHSKLSSKTDGANHIIMPNIQHSFNTKWQIVQIVN
jgi:hypothetical protein